MIAGKMNKKYLKFDERKCNSNQKCNNDKCRCDCKKYNTYEIRLNVFIKMGKKLASMSK